MEDVCMRTWVDWIVPIIGLFALYWVAKWFLQIGKNTFIFRGFFCRLDFARIVLPPLKIILIAVASYFLFSLASSYFSCDSFLSFVKTARDIAIVGSFAWMAYRWKSELFHSRSFLYTFTNQGTAHALSKLISALIVIITGLVILRLFHLDIVPLLAFGGIGAAAVGFAAKDVIGNFFGGAMLSMTRPFSSGETIFLPDRDIEGVVEEVGWYLTTIRDKDKRPVYLPNALFSNFLVINVSRMSHRRIRETLKVRYSDFSKVAELTEKIRDLLGESSEIDSQAPILVYLERLGDYSLEIYLDAYTIATEFGRYLAVKEKILERIGLLVQEMGMEIAHPTSFVHIKH
jgi:MscS family membrane protein